MYDGSCYTDGSYFLNGPLDTNDLICGHSDAGSGQALLPNTSTCDGSSRPIKCTHNDGNDKNIIVLKRVGSFDTDNELGYKCCLPNNCSDSMITANIYSK